MEPIRILQVVPNMNAGGLENLIMNIYRNIDRKKVQFDFLVHYEKRCFFDDEIEKLGGKIYRFSVREDNNVIKYIKDLKKFFKTHKEYKVIHGHMASLGFIYLKIAKKYGVPIRIAHSHGTSHLKSIKGYIKFLTFKLEKYYSNVNFACSTEAGIYLFGKHRKFEIIPNAIDFEKFRYNQRIREKIRNEMNIQNELVIGHVGRFNLQKNHIFLLDVFSEIVKKEKEAKLFLLGNGELEKDVRQKIEKLKIEKNVKLLGVREDVNEIYQAMDVFVMPSLFEGLPLTGVEAQVSGLKCFFADTITKEVIITNNAEFISLSMSAKEWAEKIIKEKEYDRSKVKIFNEDFNIKKLATKMQNKYLEYNNGKLENK